MTDLEFIGLFRIEELPECSIGLFLLKNWLESDPVALAKLQSTVVFDFLLRRDGSNASLEAWMDHVVTCPHCLLLLETVSESPDRETPPAPPKK